MTSCCLGTVASEMKSLTRLIYLQQFRNAHGYTPKTMACKPALLEMTITSTQEMVLFFFKLKKVPKTSHPSKWMVLVSSNWCNCDDWHFLQRKIKSYVSFFQWLLFESVFQDFNKKLLTPFLCVTDAPVFLLLEASASVLMPKRTPSL